MIHTCPLSMCSLSDGRSRGEHWLHWSWVWLFLSLMCSLPCAAGFHWRWHGLGMVRGSRDKVWELWGLKFKISSLKEWRNGEKQEEEDEEKDAEDGAGEMNLVIWKSWTGTKPWWGGHGRAACYFSSLCWLKVSKANPWRIPCTLCEGHR